MTAGVNEASLVREQDPHGGVRPPLPGHQVRHEVPGASSRSTPWGSGPSSSNRSHKRAALRGRDPPAHALSPPGLDRSR